MEIITSVLDLKTQLPKNSTYAITGFTRSYPIGPTHEHVVSYSLNSPLDYKMGIMWDNKYDLSVWRGFTEPPTVWDQAGAIAWFESKGFDFLFIPEQNIMQRMNALPQAPAIKAQVEQICTENYDVYLPLWLEASAGNEAYLLARGQDSWIRLHMFRMLILYTSTTGSKFIEAGDFFSGPDFTNGYIFKHFCINYVGSNSTMVPVYRNPDGTVYDHYTNSYPQDVKDMILALTGVFNQFRDDYDFEGLSTGIVSLFDNSPLFKLIEVNGYHDWNIIYDYVYRVVFMRRGVSEATGNVFRMWEYVNGI